MASMTSGAPPADARPVLLVTNHAPAFRVGAFAALHAQQDVVFALIGGDVRHGGGAGDPQNALPFPVLRPSQRAVLRLAASGRFRAVVAGLSGRIAPAAAWIGARAAGVPFVLWATMWAHPRTAPHLLGYPLVRRLYRDADAIVTYGPHVSAYVRRKGARGPVVVAPQAVDSGFWAGPAEPDRRAPFQALFAGRLEAEKGVDVLIEAWRRVALPDAALVLVGDGPLRAPAEAAGAIVTGLRPPEAVRNFYAGSDVLVLPSVATRAFREPWGLVVNEAATREIPAIVTDAVGAAAGGLVVDGRTGWVVPAADAGALAAALARAHADPALRARLGAAAHEAVAAHTQEAWAAGMAKGLAAVGAAHTPQESSST